MERHVVAKGNPVLFVKLDGVATAAPLATLLFLLLGQG